MKRKNIGVKWFSLLMVFAVLMAALPFGKTAVAAGEAEAMGSAAGTITSSAVPALTLTVLHTDNTFQSAGTVSVTAYGTGGLSGQYQGNTSYTVSGTTATFTFTIPANMLHYAGRGTAGVSFSASYSNGVVATGSYSGFAVIEDDTSSNDSPDPGPSGTGSTVSIKGDTALPEISAGESKVLEIPLVNSGGGTMRNVKIAAKLPEGIYFNTLSPSQDFGSVGRNKEMLLKLDVSAGAEAASGVYPVELTVTYDTYTQKGLTESLSFNLRVNGGDGGGSGKLIVASYTVNPKTVSAGSAFTLTLQIKNNGSGDVSDALVTLNGLSTEGITVNGGLDSRTLSKIAPGATVNVTYNLLAASGMSSGNSILDVSLSGGGGESASKVFIPVQSTGGTSSEAGDSKPLIVIESYDFGGESVEGGSTFPLTIRMKNTGKTAIENVKIVISSPASGTDSGAFTPANSSNTFFVERVAAGGVFEESIELTVRSDATPKSYGIDLDCTYEAVVNDTRESINAVETITIPVTQPDRFEVGDVNAWGPIYMGNSGYVSMSYTNKGKSTIYNLQIELIGNLTTAESSVYIGNVDSGAGDSYEFEFSPTEVGTLEGQLKFTYEDANGQQKEVLQDFSVEVLEMIMDEPVIDDMPVEPMPGEGGFPWWGYVLIGVAVVGTAAIMIVVIKKKKAKKALEADEDYDD